MKRKVGAALPLDLKRFQYQLLIVLPCDGRFINGGIDDATDADRRDDRCGKGPGLKRSGYLTNRVPGAALGPHQLGMAHLYRSRRVLSILRSLFASRP